MYLFLHFSIFETHCKTQTTFAWYIYSQVYISQWFATLWRQDAGRGHPVPRPFFGQFWLISRGRQMNETNWKIRSMISYLNIRVTTWRKPWMNKYRQNIFKLISTAGVITVKGGSLSKGCIRRPFCRPNLKRTTEEFLQKGFKMLSGTKKGYSWTKKLNTDQ